MVKRKPQDAWGWMQDTTTENRGLHGALRWVFGLGALLCAVAIVVLGRSVYSDLLELQSADHDSVQWTLSQVEIEFLDLHIALEEAEHEPAPDFSAVRKDFDIFYSRHQILSNGSAFAPARAQPEVQAALDRIGSFLNDAAPMIDADDAALQAALPALLGEVDAVRPVVRSLYLTGLAAFADTSDNTRARMSSTLLGFTVFTCVLFVALALLAAYSWREHSRSRRRGQKLARANAHMETILSTALDAVIVADSEGHVLDFNPAAEAIFGHRFEDVRGQKIGDLIVPPELREAHAAGMARMAATGEKKLVGKGRIELEAVRKDGSRLPVELALQSAISDAGEIVIAFLRDITAQKESEAALTEARDAALAGERAKSEFLAVMSHEIRTPLNGLLGNLALMGDTRQDPEQRQYQSNMEISGRQLMQHVNAILDIARFEAGKLPVEEAPLHLGAFLQEVVDGQASAAERNGTAISWAWAGASLDWVSADRGRIEQILLNLVGNAIKFTRNGRIDIELEQDEAAPIGAPNVEFRVIDSGIGIPEADLGRIFEDFETSGPPVHGKESGTGLGLSIARRLVQLLGGEIGVESTEGEGSVFWFRLPLPPCAAPADADPAPAAKPRLPRMHVLVAEDNEINAFVVKRLLEKSGHACTLAANGAEAVAAACDGGYDVILMDINMPVMDGLTATRQIRDPSHAAHAVPIYAFSANVLPEHKEKYLQGGMNGFLGKPVSAAEIDGVLREVAGLSAGSAEKSPAPGARTALRNGYTVDLMGADGYNAMLARFRDEIGALFTEAEALMEADAPDAGPQISALAHKALASAGLFGAEDFGADLRQLETLAKSAKGAALAEAVARARTAWEATEPRLAGA
ncbi:PAS domain-containing hybrid sensor histidine kinase/response regulator [Pseudoruegeria sp. SHC-113]|uniref:hybrid sensor histidine kinase/response regulator n=1 Tax=Pseudoruegeria sp. SHC-113 TaxID=2855439 RepID=UPI0021BB0EC2|nr:PAS domain-containing hybrid sensor histidine kinase/response regulator [Pseudoruegeria sp. SHC-113]MCT8160092.1 PAS domain S-box protein [Pseudoruegeria sp. SHC-113]